MIEKDNIDKLTFIESIANECLKRWNEFIKRRTTNIVETTKEIRNLIEKMRNQKN
jgi:hypothetical protein